MDFWTSLSDLFFTTDLFLYTGMAVWSVILAALLMLVLVRLVTGVVSSLSHARWSLRSGCAVFDFAFVLSVFANVWMMRRGPRHGGIISQYRSLNGGYWKSAFDFADSGRTVRDRLIADRERNRRDAARAVLREPIVGYCAGIARGPFEGQADAS